MENLNLFCVFCASFVGDGFASVMKEPIVASFLFGAPPREAGCKSIYERSALRKARD